VSVEGQPVSVEGQPVSVEGQPVSVERKPPDMKTGAESEDPLLQQIGGVGRWQLLTFSLLAFFCIPAGWQILVVDLHAPADADFWCRPPPAFANWSSDQWRRYSAPHNHNQRGDVVWDGCGVYSRDYSRAPEDPDRPPPPATNATRACLRRKDMSARWQFSHAAYQRTISEHFGLVCEYRYLVETAKAAFHIGGILGVFFGGIISDRFGRRPAVLVLLVVMFLASVAVSFSNTIMLYIVLRFLLALTVFPLYTIIFVFCMETVAARWRLLLGMLYQVMLSLGFMSLAGIATVVSDWQHLQLAVSAPLLFCSIYYWAVSESPRWLLAAGKVSRAAAILESVAQINGREYDQTVQLVPQHEERTHVVVTKLLHQPTLRRRTLSLWLVWLANGLVYYGLRRHFDVDGLTGGRVHVRVLVGGAVDVFSCGVAGLACLALGRRRTILAAMELTGLCLLASAAFEKGEYAGDWPLLLLLLLTRFFASAAFCLVFVYSAELLPTGLRCTGLGSAAAFSKLGALLVPAVAGLSSQYYLPALVPAVCVMAAGGLLLMLPETQRLKMPDTLHAAATLGVELPAEPVLPVWQQTETTATSAASPPTLSTSAAAPPTLSTATSTTSLSLSTIAKGAPTGRDALNAGFGPIQEDDGAHEGVGREDHDVLEDTGV